MSITDWLPAIRFLVAFVVFIAPGWALMASTDRAAQRHWITNLSFGFMVSFAVFFLAAWPFLWFGGSMAAFQATLLGIWPVYVAISLAVLTQARRWDAETVPAETDAGGTDAPPSPVSPEAAALARKAVAAYLAMAILLSGFRAFTRERGTVVESAAQLALIAIGIPLMWWCRRMLAGELGFTSADERPAPGAWTWTAALLVGFQAVMATLIVRADWDDCFYLAAVEDYRVAKTFNDQEPTHREGFAMPAIQWLLGWELWGAVLCNVAGMNALTLFHTFLPGPLVVLAYGAYAALFACFLPRKWVPLAIIGLSAVHLFGISSHWTAANTFLVRIWQGKAVLLQIAIPLTVTALLRFAKAPSWNRWWVVVGANWFGLAASFSAVFMNAILVGGLSVAIALSQPAGRLRFLAAAWLTLAPLLAFGAAVWWHISGETVYQARPVYMKSWLSAMRFYTYYGSAETLWIFVLPVLALLLIDGWRRVYLVGFPVIILLTFGNPLVFDLVAGNLTSYLTYFRLWWLLPVGVGLGAAVALLARWCGVAWGWERSRWREWFTLGAALAAASVLVFLPGIYVWGPGNNWVGAWGAPRLMQNLEKLPSDLKAIAEHLERDPAIGEGSILCSEETASFLAPYSRAFRFVQTRPYYTQTYLARLGRHQEGWERYSLARAVVSGRLPDRGNPQDFQEVRDVFGNAVAEKLLGVGEEGKARTLPEMLARYRVVYVVVGPGDNPGDVFERSGYRLRFKWGDYSMWKFESDFPEHGRPRPATRDNGS